LWVFIIFSIKIVRYSKRLMSLNVASPGFSAWLAFLNISKYPRQVTLLDEPVTVYVCKMLHPSLSHWRDNNAEFRTGVTMVSALSGCSTETISFCVVSGRLWSAKISSSSVRAADGGWSNLRGYIFRSSLTRPHLGISPGGGKI